MAYARADALVSTDWLARRLGEAGVRPVDATWYMPNQPRMGRQDYDERHIPGAVFWDIDAIADPASGLPHMLPTEARMAEAMAELGIGTETHVVVYDSFGMMSAARVWWTLRAFGHGKVAVLDGGMAKWLAEGRAVETTPPRPSRARFTARLDPRLVRSLEEVRANIARKHEQVLDARSAGRFCALEPEPRPNCRPGHIPGSLNLPFTELIDAKSKTMLPADQLAKKFLEAGIDPKRPVVTSCGSGITACVLALGLHLLGCDNVAVYDGSWTEWGGRQDTPIEP